MINPETCWDGTRVPKSDEFTLLGIKQGGEWKSLIALDHPPTHLILSNGSVVRFGPSDMCADARTYTAALPPAQTEKDSHSAQAESETR